VVHTDPVRHILQRHSVKAMLGEQFLGSVENLLDHFRALRRLG